MNIDEGVDPLTCAFSVAAAVAVGGFAGYLLGRGHEHDHMQQLIDEERSRYPGARGLPLATLDYRIRMGRSALEDARYLDAPRTGVLPSAWRLEQADAERPSYRVSP